MPPSPYDDTDNNNDSPTNPPWISTIFLSNGKIRHRERYTHNFNPIDTSLSHPSSSPTPIIPDADSLRKYLPLFEHISSSSSPYSSSTTELPPFSIVILESTAEYMDYLHTTRRHPIIHDNERHRLLKMLSSSPLSSCYTPSSSLSSLSFQSVISSLPDLSLHTPLDDTDGAIQYKILRDETWGASERYRHSLIRAARLTGGIILTNDETFQNDERDDENNDHDDDNTNNNRRRWSLMSLATFCNAHGSESWSSLLSDCDETYRRHHDDRDAITKNDDNPTTTAGYTPYITLSPQSPLPPSHHRGTYTVSKRNRREGRVTVASTGDIYRIDGRRKHDNRAFPDDTVVISVLPREEWSLPDDDDDDVDATIIPAARIVAVVKRRRRQFVATITPSSSSHRRDDDHVLAVPMDPRLPIIRIDARRLSKSTLDTYERRRLVVAVDGWDTRDRHPHGRIVEVLGAIGDLETEVSGILRERELVMRGFSAAAMAEVPEGEWRVEEGLEGRLDLRGRRLVFSVDPVGCQDIDDAMHAEVLPNGNIEIGVHIADVDHFVKKDSHLDREAMERGTTFYLVDRRFDMLPSRLSSDLCSLHGKHDRMAVSVIWTLSPDFDVLDVWFGRTVIHNSQAMTYDQAHSILHSLPLPPTSSTPPLTAGHSITPTLLPSLLPSLQILTKIAHHRRNIRESNGAIDLSSTNSELKFTLDPATKTPLAVTPKEEKDIHSTVAELMIMANTTVAERIAEWYPQEALLRVHAPMDAETVTELSRTLVDDDVAEWTTATVAEGLKRYERSNRREAVVYANTMVARSLTEAEYVGAGTTKKGGGHYGLGVGRYTHFTSPIRRYADVVVHRFLLEGLERMGGSGGGVGGGGAVGRRGRGRWEGGEIGGVDLPESTVMSVLHPSGHDGNTVTPTSLPSSSRQRQQLTTKNTTPPPYSPTQIAKIATHINTRNRLAKISSRDCQSLFLSLYFRHQSLPTYTTAIVTSLRESGVAVYVPRYDMRGFVYFRDAGGSVQFPPGLLGLAEEEGDDAALGFRGVEGYRSLPDGTCVLREGVLEVSVEGRGRAFEVKVLDVVRVRLSCEEQQKEEGVGWEARVPPTRIHLVGMGDGAGMDNDGGEVERRGADLAKKAAKATTMKEKRQVNRIAKDENNCDKTKIVREGLSTPLSMYQIITSLIENNNISIVDAPPTTTKKSQQKNNTTTTTRQKPHHKTTKNAHRVQTIKGRFVFNEFCQTTDVVVNSITTSGDGTETTTTTTGSAASSLSHYDDNRRIEREITSRTQRLMAGKRNTRKAAKAAGR